MAETTAITWAHATFNPWEGCTKISPGCDGCYAAARDDRFHSGVHWGPGAPRQRTAPANWRKPLAWNRKAAAAGKPFRVFCASLADVFDNAVDPEWRFDLWQLIEATPALTWMLLSKRIGNAAAMLPGVLPNVWLLATVVNQEEAARDIPKLLATPAAVHGISYEPALGPLKLGQWLCPTKPMACSHCGAPHVDTRWYAHRPHRLHSCQSCGGKFAGDLAYGSKNTRPRIDWVICGGESGPHARPMDPAWAMSVRDQCAAAEVAFFFKQRGGARPGGDARLNGREHKAWPDHSAEASTSTAKAGAVTASSHP